MKLITTQRMAALLHDLPAATVITVLRPPQGRYPQQRIEVQASVYQPWPGDLVTVNQTQYRIITDP